MKTIVRIINSLKIAVWCFRNPQTIQASNFKMLSDLLTLILKVSSENRPYMTHIAFVHPGEGEKNIVSIWAGASMTADPTERISELLRENRVLKDQLSSKIRTKVDL